MPKITSFLLKNRKSCPVLGGYDVRPPMLPAAGATPPDLNISPISL